MSLLLVALAVAVSLLGCGGARREAKAGAVGRASARSASAAYRYKHRQWPTQPVAPAMAACKGPVERTTSLPASARREIEAPCASMDERVKENEVIVHAVCEELELASGAAGASARAKARNVAASCYAGYVRTIPPEERRRAGVSSSG